MSWRDSAAPIIAKTIREATGRDRKPYTDEQRKAARKALRDAYPFGDREYWPYKVWCDEVRRQLGEKKPKQIENQMELIND